MMARAKTLEKARPGRQTTEKNIESILKLEEKDEQELYRRFIAFHAVDGLSGRSISCCFNASSCCCGSLRTRTCSATATRSNSLSVPTLLSTVLAMEAVLLTSFVLIRQKC